MSRRGSAGLALALALAALPAGAGDDPRRVSVARLGDVAVPLGASAPAEVVSLARTPVPARLAAEVEAIPVELGDRVAAGDALARLDCADFRDALERADARLHELEARLQLAAIRLERTRRLRARDAVAADRLDEAEAERDALAASVDSQRAAVAAARRDVARCRVEAPYAGIVVARAVDPGAFVQPGTTLVELVATDRVEVRARLSAADVDGLAGASGFTLRAGGARYPLELTRVVAAADPATRTRQARLRFTGGNTPVPGTAGRLHWVLTGRAVPAHLLVRRDGRLGVMVAADGRARFHALAGAVEGRPAATDLPADTALIVDGRHAVTDGAAVIRDD